MIGVRLNHYEILRKLGSGGMGDVYAARDTNLGREVALKILPGAMARDEERLERFRREATAVAALDHPNIVTIFSIENAPGAAGEAADAASSFAPGETIHFLTMQLVEGSTLGELIPRRGLSLDRFFDIAIPLADAVAAAHEKGITHRDLKPTNIMVTPEGRVKVLDFGLAKLTEAAGGLDETEASEAATLAAAKITEEGRILGTAAYMSPEQAEGKLVDHRTDIFSLGIILYELATGESPFQGDSRISILSSVLNDEPALVTEVNRSAPRHLGRIVGHSLEKDPKRRFQSTLDLRNELEALREEVDSSVSATVSAVSQTPAAWSRVFGRRGWQLALAALGVVAAITLGPQILDRFGGAKEPAPSPATVPAATAVAAIDVRPSLAILYFDNASDAPDLDWLRTGLPEMLVTDLSQSRGIRVLTTDRMYGILADAGVLEAGASEALDATGDSLGVDRVLLGSVLRAGDRIRIVARLQDVSSGEIVASETLEGATEEDLFDLVDDLTMRVRATFTGLSTGGGTDRDLTDVTTSSVDALRLWVEADRYLNLSRPEEARGLLLRAVEIDPEFAMAYAKLAALSGNMGNLDARIDYAEAALRHADHLTERERYYIEGTYYYGIYEEVDRAASAFGGLLDFDPSSTAARNNLALALQRLGRDDEAIAHFEVLVENGVEFVGTWTNLAESYANQGRFEDAEDVLQRLAEREPESFWPYDARAELYLRQGRFEDVLDAVQEAQRRGSPITRRFEVDVGILTRNWALAETIDALAAQETEPSTVFGDIPFIRGYLALFRGDSATALRIMQTALDEVPDRSTFASWLQDGLGYVYEARGDLGEAIRATQLAADEARRNQDIMWELSVLGRLQARDGQLAAARATGNRLDTLTSGWPEVLASRHKAMLAAAIASAEGNPAAAVAILDAEAAKLDPSGKDDPPHCDVWFRLALAHIGAGDEAAATPWLQLIVDATTERTGFPVEYVRSLYLLGKIYADRDDNAVARSYFELFLEHWGDGDVGRDEVGEARAWLAAH